MAVRVTLVKAEELPRVVAECIRGRCSLDAGKMREALGSEGDRGKLELSSDELGDSVTALIREYGYRVAYVSRGDSTPMIVKED